MRVVLKELRGIQGKLKQEKIETYRGCCRVSSLKFASRIEIEYVWI